MAATVGFELYGVPRMKAGVARVDVEAATLADALRGLVGQCPALAGSVVQDDGSIRPAYRVSLNSERFLTDPATRLSEGDVLLLLAADVGG